MNIREGQVVSIEDSDSRWVVTSVDKFTCNLIDEGMGIWELSEVPLTDVTEIIEDVGWEEEDD